MSTYQLAQDTTNRVIVEWNKYPHISALSLMVLPRHITAKSRQSVPQNACAKNTA